MRILSAIRTAAIVLSLTSVTLLASCGKDGSSTAAGNESDDANGILAPLAKKYIEISENRLESDKALKELEADGFSESAQKKADKVINGINEKNNALEAEAKTLAEGLKGKTIACTATEATGLTGPECQIYGIKASGKSANVVLAFKGSATTDKVFGCLFKDDGGQTIYKIKTFVNGDGTLGVIYMITTKDNAESARIAARTAEIALVSEAEYNAATTAE